VAAFAVVVNTLQVKEVADRVAKINSEEISRASLGAVNQVAERTFTESRRLMTQRVNLTEAYVRERMAIEAANDVKKPTATIIAFRSGGRRKGVRPVNLRQYFPLYEYKSSRPNPGGRRKVFAMRDGRLATSPLTANPRAPDKKLPFILRTGNSILNIPVGQKPGKLSVSVLKGQRKVIKPDGGFDAFMQKMPKENGGQILVMRRINRNGGKKGKGQIEPLYSLSVWQLFRNAAAQVIPIAEADLVRTVGEAVSKQVDEAFR